jgi:ubiquinol-cytochrome c reductase cytochrome c subunit
VRRILPLLVLLLAGLGVTACSYFREEAVEPFRTPAYYGPPESAAGAGPVDPGRQLYLRDCAYCHGDDGKGTTHGPDITHDTNGEALTDFVLRTGRMPVEAEVDQMTPGESVYDDGQIAAIVSYVSTQFRQPGPKKPELHLNEGDLGEGQELYQEHCASCHAPTGIGGAMLIQSGKSVPGKNKGIVIPNFEASDAQAIADAVRAGPASMPVFGPHTISDHELNSLVRYVRYLKDPDDEGGAPIGRIGPVVEGAVGWFFGLGLLVLVTRWIGTKAGEVE